MRFSYPFSFRRLATWMAAVGLAIGMTLFPSISAQAEPLTSAASTAAQAMSSSGPSSFVTAAVNRVGPAVVRIDTERTVTRQTGSDPLLEDPFFRRFFGEDL
ncbi:serine protease, partial [Leptolyngbya sp. FACHB-36]|nr:serine protease [Leptolyngbya sp. FACHB-36]